MKVVAPVHRAVCSRCLRPTRVCVCALLPALAPVTRVLILQHPRERRMAIGTARMASRCLSGSIVVTGTRLDDDERVVRALDDPARPAVLLWPGPGAKDLAVERPGGPVTLVVVDGTWTTARKLLDLNPRIAALARYALSPTTPSEYRIRREPRAECLSTIEALSNALGRLEGEPERYGAMMTPFRAMIDAQLSEMARGPRPRDTSRLVLKRRKVWSMPERLRDPSRVVLVAAEANAWPLDAADRHPDEIVHLLAVRADGGAAYERLARPEHPPAPAVARHTGIALDELLGGGSRAELAASFAAFLRDGDVLATWGTYAPRRLAAEGLVRGIESFDLRRIAADAMRASPGSIEACVARLGLDAPTLGRGRGGRRLGHIRAVFDALRAGRIGRGTSTGG